MKEYTEQKEFFYKKMPWWQNKDTLVRAIILALGGSAKIIALPSVFLDILK